MSEAWPSTKGLSVFNALKIVGRMTPDEIHGFLAVNWDPAITQKYVDDGINFLDAKLWIQHLGNHVSLSVPANKMAVRDKDDSDLKLVTYPVKQKR